MDALAPNDGELFIAVWPVNENHTKRCETRLAIQDKAIALLRAYREGNDPRANALADYLSSRRGRRWLVNPNTDLPDADERRFYDRYIQTGIAYDFTLDITEENRAALLADPVRLITNGTAGIGLSASADFSRNNARRFIMSDTFAYRIGRSARRDRAARRQVGFGKSRQCVGVRTTAG